MSIKLNKRQQIAAEMLGLGHRPSEVARVLDTSRETISRWQRGDNFMKVVHATQSGLLETIIQDRNRLLDESHRVLFKAFSSSNIPIQTKANLAIRFLSMAGSSSNIYFSTERIINTRVRLDDESEQAFTEIMETLDTLAELKAAGQHIS